jgi:nucleoside-diphosphate-sugar epimerase
LSFEPADKTKTILVTGGRGFIGRPLVRHFVESQGETVLSVDVLPAGRADGDARRIDIELDIRDRDGLREVFAHFNIFAVYDLASITKVKLAKSEYLPNTEMTQPTDDTAISEQCCDAEVYASLVQTRMPRITLPPKFAYDSGGASMFRRSASTLW